MSSLHQTIAAIVAQHSIISDSIVCQAAAIAGASEVNKAGRKPNSRYKCHGTLCKPKKSTWWRTLKKGDDLEFLHFTSLTRPAFSELVEACRLFILTNPIDPAHNPPKNRHLARRMFSPRDIMAMTLKWILSKSGQKNLNAKFVALASTYSNCVMLGLCAMAYCLADHPKAKVYWDQSIEALDQASERTKMFLDVPHVVVMIDGTKIHSKTS